jgi:hypothetical protein
MSLVVRGTQSVESLVPAVREAIWRVDRELPVTRISTMESLLADTAAERRFIMLLFELFAATALVLTMAGIYGMMAGLVAEAHSRDRVAQGGRCDDGQIVGLVFRFGARVTGIGLLVGLAGAAFGRD